MLRVNWTNFGASVRAHILASVGNYSGTEKLLSISHARLHNAAHGKPVGTEIFLTLCHWMAVDPMHYCFEEQA